MVQFTYNSKSLYATSRWKKNLKNQPQNLHNKSISFLRAIEINKRSRKQRSFDRIGWTKSGNPCPIERFDGYRSHVGTIRAGYKFPRVDQFKYAWGTHGGKKKKKKRKQRGNEIDRQDEGDWVVSRPTSLTPIEECLVGSDEGRRVAGGNRAALTDYREG